MCTAWAARKEQNSRIQATQACNVLRRIDGQCAGGTEVTKSEEVLRRLGQVGVLELVRRRLEEWKGRLDMMENGRCTKNVYEGVVEGKRPRGRPRLRWIDNFK